MQVFRAAERQGAFPCVPTDTVGTWRTGLVQPGPSPPLSHPKRLSPRSLRLLSYILPKEEYLSAENAEDTEERGVKVQKKGDREYPDPFSETWQKGAHN